MRDTSLIADIKETDFWQMTVGEAVRACDAYVSKRKDIAYFAYTNAMTTGLFISSMFSKTPQPPSIEAIYPELFEQDEEAEAEAQDNRSIENFMKFAHAINERFQNGNGKPQSENNG